MDLVTLYAVVGTTSLLIGIVGIGAQAAGRFGEWPLRWGLSNLLLGLGHLGIAVQAKLGIPPLVTLCNIAVVAGSVLLLGGVRNFAHRELPAWAAGAATLAALLSFWFANPGDFVARVSVFSAILAAFDLAIAFEGLRLARKEHLRSGWVLASLFLISGTMFVARSVLTAKGVFGTQTLFGAGSETQALFAIPAAGILMLRGMALVLLAAERHHQRMEALAFHDPLTGALTRQGLRHAKETLLRGVPNRWLNACVVVIDVDRFKQINDTLGHAMGDAALKRVAVAARSVLPKQGFVARWGGDEFVLLLPATGPEEALAVGKALQDAIRDDGLAEVSVTLSIGIAEGTLRLGSLDSLLEKADAALYEVKRAGRDGAGISKGDRPDHGVTPAPYLDLVERFVASSTATATAT